ncbi:GMC oxidoreductase [Microbacterium halophytorum]|uniref:GMC oxidoreductase n=1 Tax=Microbacterium halophytorum TaxID=2067568 RepID=UPI000CFAFDD7|nr:GMC family oxidoreductase [Microbacterium halophytorum]
MSTSDYDVIVVGSGFGGSVAALRAAEKGYRVGVLEAGRRWPDSEIPRTNWDLRRFVWQPELETYGIQRVEVLDDVLVLSGAGVGGGSHVYGNTLYVPPRQFFAAKEWAGITDWAEELAPYIDLAQRMLGVVRVPYLPTDVDRYMQKAAQALGHGETFNRAPVGVYFGKPGVEADDPYFGGAGPRRTGCVNCGNCMIGCGRGAKNKLTVNYLYLAEKLGVDVHELSEVHDIEPLDGGGYAVSARHPGWAQRAVHAGRRRFTADQVIIAAHAYGSSKLLHHMRAKNRLTVLSDELGKRARTNSEQLISIQRPYDEWKRDPERYHVAPGAVSITSGVWPDAQTSIEPVTYGVGSNVMEFLLSYHQHGAQAHPTANFVKHMLEHPVKFLESEDARHWSERMHILLCMQTTDTSIDLFWKDGVLRSRPGQGELPSPHIPIVEQFADKIAELMGSEQQALAFEVVNRTASAHFIGGLTIGDTSDTGVVDPYQRVFGHPGLHVMDGSVMPANPGVNPSLMITALAERAMSLWPNKGEADARPALGSSYRPVDAVRARRQAVPDGSPAEYRLDVTAADIIPEYPY